MQVKPCLPLHAHYLNKQESAQKWALFLLKKYDQKEQNSWKGSLYLTQL